MRCVLPFLFATVAITARAETIGLSKLDLNYVAQEAGKAQANHALGAAPLVIAGKSCTQGMGTSAISYLFVQLAGSGDHFKAAVGVDDKANAAATVDCRVYLDGKVAFDSGVMHRGDVAKAIDLDLAGVKVVELYAGDGGDGNVGELVDWVDASFDYHGAAPQAILAPSEPAVRLTPPTPAMPRFNGAKVFGVRPSSPFLFTVAASGDRPMRFSAEGLPEGLSIDSSTGQISGLIAAAGEHLVTLHADNAKGAVTGKLKIVCGDTLALSPPMGWNDWYCWTSRVNDKILRDAADAMVSSGMAGFGYQYVNVDDCWSMAGQPTKDESEKGEPRDARGRINSNKYFPDMKALTDYIHSKGLKAGIYSSPGPLTCGKNIASYQHEAEDAQQFADWGFDFLKYDWCSYGRIVPKPDAEGFRKPYRLISDELKKQKRDIVLNLCQYGMGDVWKWGRDVGGISWRTADDLGGMTNIDKPSVRMYRDLFELYADKDLYKFAQPGSWNDPDYLLLGKLWVQTKIAPTPLTTNEQYTQVSICALHAAPLIFTGDMTQLDDFTLGLLCNSEVIDIDQDSLGHAAHRVAKRGDKQVWVRDLEDGSIAVGLFNWGETTADVSTTWAELGLKGKQRVHDIWREKDLGDFDSGFSSSVGRHGVTLIRLTAPKD